MQEYREEDEARDVLEETEAMENADERTDKVKMTVTLPRSVAAFLRWKAEVEGLKRDELLRRIVVHYAKKLRDRDMRTPPIMD